MSHFSVRDASSFLFRSSKFYHYIVLELHLNHCKTSPCSFNFSFISFYHPFITGVLHGGSTWWFVKDSFHSSFVLKVSLEVKIRQAILSNKHGVQHMFCFEEFKHSSSCIPNCNSFYLVCCGGVMSFLTISFVFHDSQVVRNEVFKPIIFFLGVILVYISPEAFHWECCSL